MEGAPGVVPPLQGARRMVTSSGIPPRQWGSATGPPVAEASDARDIQKYVGPCALLVCSTGRCCCQIGQFGVCSRLRTDRNLTLTELESAWFSVAAVLPPRFIGGAGVPSTLFVPRASMELLTAAVCTAFSG